MQKKNIKSGLLLSVLLVYVFIYRFIILKSYLKYSESLTAALIILLTGIAILILGFQKDKENRIKKYVTKMTLTIIVVFFAISYAAGLVVGFLKNAYSLNFASIIDNTFAPIVIIICTELFRYVLISGNKNNKIMTVLTTVVVILFELALNVKGIDPSDLTGTFKTTTALILPIISKNLVLSYLSYKVGFKPGLAYRLIMDIYVYIMPIIPDLGDYLNSMIGIGLPFILYIYTSRALNEYYNGIEREYRKETFKIADIPVVAFIVVLVCLVSGFFPYYLIGVGSGSMYPKIKKGDAVIIHKIKSAKELKVGQVIAFKSGNKVYVHRLIQIEKKDNKVYYRTKGDANNTPDYMDLTIKDVKGIVKFDVAYIAYPSVYLSEFMSKEKKG